MVFPEVCRVPWPRASRHRLAEPLRELSVLFNDVLLGTSDSDAVSLHIIYYTFRAVSKRTCPKLCNESNSKMLLASVLGPKHQRI